MTTNTPAVHTHINECNAIAQNETLPAILSQVAYLRVWQVCDCKRPGVSPLIPISRTAFLDGVNLGIYPKPIKIGRSACWKAQDIKQLLLKLG